MCPRRRGGGGFNAASEPVAGDVAKLADLAFSLRDETGRKRFVCIDDLECITSSSLIEDFLRLCSLLPPEYHFVASTRKLSGGLKLASFKYGDIGFELSDLAFSRAESEGIVRGICGEGVSAELVDAIYDGTEGWIQGIKLRSQAAMLNRKLGVEPLVNGKSNLIRDFFSCNVLSGLSQEDVAFLTRASLFESFNRSLLAFAFESDDVVELFNGLLDSNAFILNCDYENEWYRLHPMFLDVLRCGLAQVDMSELRGICLKASEWFHENRRSDDAVKYLMMSGDLDYIEGLVEITSGLSRPDKSDDSLMWMCRVPAASIPGNPFLCLMATWSCVTFARLEDADIYMDVFKKLAKDEKALGDAGPDALVFSMKCLEMKYLAMRGEGEEALRLCEELQSGEWPISPSLLSMINQSEGEAYSSIGDYDQAMEYYLKAQASASVSQTIHQLVYNEYSYAVNLYYYGEHDKAEQRCELLIRKCPPDFSIYGATCALLARILMERAETEHVSELLRISKQDLFYYRHIDLYLDIMAAHALWYLSSGESSKAFEVITEAILQGEKYRDVPREALLSAYFLQAQIALYREDVREVQRIERKFAPRLKERDILGTLLLDTIHAFAPKLQGDNVKAVLLLDEVIVRAKEHDFNRIVVISLVEKTLALHDAGEETKSIISFNDLIFIARQQGYMRSILNGGRPMSKLVREYAATRKLGGFLRGYVKEILQFFDAEASGRHKSASEDVAFLQDEYMLTEREAEVLRLLNMGFSRNEIADTLSISINTAKKYLSSVYMKMGVRNKAEALGSLRQDMK